MFAKSHITVQELNDLAKQIFAKAGFTPEESDVLADEIVEAQCRGLSSHGASLIIDVVQHFTTIEPSGPIEVVKETSSSAFIRGNGNVGSIVSVRAMDLAMKKAEDSGFGIVGTSNITPFLIGSYNPLRAARKGLIGINWTATAGPGEVAPWGGRDHFLSIDPVSIALPTAADPIVLDMTWIASGGAPHLTIPAYKELGKKLPEGWALDTDGNPTTDPDEALESGVILPFGGPRGSGMMIMLHLLAQGLVGETRENTSGEYTIEGAMTTTIFVAARPDAFVSSEEFARVVSLHAATVTNSRPAPGFDEVLLPGQRGDKSRAIALAKGFPIRESVLLDKDSKEPYIPRDVYERLLELV